MIIGVDTGALSIDDERLKVGVYYVTYNLLLNICRNNPSDLFRLYSFNPLDKRILRDLGANVQNSCLRPALGWYSIRMPLELLLHPPDVYLGLSQAMPRFMPNKSIGFIYDLAFLHSPKSYPDSRIQLVKQTRSVINRSSHIVTISQTSKMDIVATYGYEAENITVAYPGVRDIFKPEGIRIKRRNPYFLFVGALKRVKNIPTMLEAFHEFLNQQNKTYDLILVGGDYWMDENIVKCIKSLRLNNRVKVIGRVSDNNLAKYYRSAVGLLTPSLWEGFCLPAAEAMACGCPVIGSWQGALPEIVGNAGILVDPFNTHEIAKSMMRIAIDNRVRSSLIKKGLTKSKLYSWENFARDIYTVVKSVSNRV